MNGAQVFFYGVAYGQFLAGGSGGGEEPNRPWHPKSAHEADADPPAPRRLRKKPKKQQQAEGAPALPAAAAPAAAAAAYPCPVCHRLFDGVKAVHGHQRSHPERDWRGMERPRQLPAPPIAADGRQYRYACDRCGAPFETRQALGGHRASHSGKMGCFWLSRQNLQEDQQEQPAAAAAAVDVAPPPPPPPPAAAAAAPPAPDAEPPMPVFAFDLNELPVPEEEE